MSTDILIINGSPRKNKNCYKISEQISKTLNENEIGCDLKAELWVSKNENYPSMGEKVAEIENIKLNSIELPAIKTELSKFNYSQEEFNGSLKLDYQTINLENNKVTVELQKKVSGNSYVTQTDKIESVNGIIENQDGVFEIELNSSGNINLEFVDGFEKQNGTYRMIVKENDIQNVCNFVIV